MEFIYIDLILLALFTVFVVVFLLKNRKKLQVESKIFLLYKTKVGIKFIKWASKVLSPIMPVLTWVSISFGFILMAVMTWLLVRIVFLVAQTPYLINAPPIMPLLPYVPQLFNISYLPNFYFIHWIVAIILLATTHEAAHGIFASFFKIKIKSTGFGFLGPFLAAFVEPDEKVLRKRNAKQQLSILAAGSFSNLVFAGIFLLLFHLFLISAYTPAGIGNYVFMYSSLNISDINSIGEYSPDAFLDLSEEQLNSVEDTLTVKMKKDNNYYLTPTLIKDISQNKNLVIHQGTLVAFQDTPAFNSKLSGGILKINGQEIKNINDFMEELSKYNSGDKIKITTTEGDYEIILDEHPVEKEKAYLGIAFPISSSPLAGITSPYFNPYLHVEPKFDTNLISFIETFFTWIIYIFFLVALFNMLPLGFLDGGRFLYVFAFALTKSRKAASFIFRIFSSLIILIFFLIMFIWVFKIGLG